MAGHVLQKNYFDYGIDEEIRTFDENGLVESGDLIIQLKSTDHIQFNQEKNAIAFDLSQRDLEAWLKETSLFILLLYDAQLEKAYFLDLQSYFQETPGTLINVRKFVRVYLPVSNLWTVEAVQNFRNLKNQK